MDAKCSTMSTEGEKETSWRHEESWHDSSIIKCAFFITRGSTQRVDSVGLIFVSVRKVKDNIFLDPSKIHAEVLSDKKSRLFEYQ